MQRSQTYSDYLRLDRLLDLQQPRSEGPEHDEMLFIVIHQVYELWFKETLHELDYLRDRLHEGNRARSLDTLERILTILKTLVAQIDVLETMTPLDFLSFRDRLESASGFESFQFREMEFALGHKSESVIERFPENSDARANLSRRLGEPSIWQAFLGFLAARDYDIPSAALEPDPAEPTRENAEVQRALIRIYRSDADLSQLCERFVDLDEGIQEWRYRHVKMVQRTIGTRRGTGGSLGAEYLKGTLFDPLFPDLWAIRTDL